MFSWDDVTYFYIYIFDFVMCSLLFFFILTLNRHHEYLVKIIFQFQHICGGKVNLVRKIKTLSTFQKRQEKQKIKLRKNLNVYI